MPDLIRILADRGLILVNPAVRLGSSFSVYLQATARAGARFNRERGCQTAPASKADAVVKELTAAGFHLEVDESLAPYLEDRRQELAANRERAKALHDKAAERLKGIEASLALRGEKLLSYQPDGILWLSPRRAGLLGDEPGLGKTVQALLAILEGAPILVVAPAAVKWVWVKEVRRFRQDLGWPRVLEGRGSFRWPRTHVQECRLCRCPLHAEVGEYGTKHAAHLRARVENPPVLGLGSSDSRVEHGGPGVVEAADGRQPVHESKVGVPHLESPAPAFRRNAAQRSFPVDYPGEVGARGKTSRERERLADSLPWRENKSPSPEYLAESVTPKAKPDADAGVRVPGVQPLHGRGALGDRDVCSRCAHPILRVGQVVVTNYDILPTPESSDPEHVKPSQRRYHLPESIGDPTPGTVMILDEVHCCKQPSTKRYKAVRLLGDRVYKADGHLWGLTGTPLVNNKDELWHVLNVLHLAHDAYGTRALYDSMWHMTGTGAWVPEAGVAERLKRVMLRRLKDEVLPSLLPLTHVTVKVKMDEATTKLADELLEKFREAGIDLEKIQSAGELARRMRGTDLTLGDISRVRAAIALSKVPRTVELVEELEAQGKPVVVWSSYLGPVEALSKRDGWLRITGAEAGALRDEIVRKFRTGAFKGIACTIRAAGVGIDGLQHASSDAIMNDKDWTPGWNKQAGDRLHRNGQGSGVTITSVVSDHPLDARLDEILHDKTQANALSVDRASQVEVGQQFPAEIVEAHPDTVTLKPKADLGNPGAWRSRPAVPMARLFSAFVAAGRADEKSRPVIRIAGIELHLAGELSRYRGQVQVTNGMAFGTSGNLWYGRIDAVGFHRSESCSDAVLAQLKALDDDPDRVRTLLGGGGR